jgi:cryptochrome
MPAKYIFSPWTAPLAVQQKAGCIIGQDYPLPIVDHDVARDRNMGMMKAAYGAGAVPKDEEDDGHKSPEQSQSSSKRVKHSAS